MEIALLKLLHVLAFVYWLGGDLGVFYTSFYVSNRSLTPQTRVTVIRILFALDMAPRICVTLMLAIGIHLSYRIGFLPVAPVVIYVTWLISLAWLAVVLYQHYGKNRKFQQFLTNFDFGFRIALIAGLSTYAAVSLSGQSGVSADFIAWKMLIFATIIACGLMIRIKLKPFGSAFANLQKGEPSQADEDVLSGSISATRPWVIVIWLGLLLSAALGLHLI